MNGILALDLGTQLGWATLTTGLGAMGVGELTDAGTLVLAGAGDLKYAKKLRMDRRLDIRVMAFTDWLWRQPKRDWIIFEDVKFASSQAQAHLWASFRGVVWTYAHQTGTQPECLDTSKLKLWTTGHGNATKEMMAFAASRRWHEHTVGQNLDDNAIDALCLLQWARETIKV